MTQINNTGLVYKLLELHRRGELTLDETTTLITTLDSSVVYRPHRLRWWEWVLGMFMPLLFVDRRAS